MRRSRRPRKTGRNHQISRCSPRRKKCHMRRMRVLMANEPRSFREVFTSVLRTLRPNIEVIEVDPEDLDPEVERLRPDLVVCSRISSAVEREAPSWILLYPENEPVGMIYTAGDLSTMNDLDLDRLIAIVDRAAMAINGGSTPLP